MASAFFLRNHTFLIDDLFFVPVFAHMDFVCVCLFGLLVFALEEEISAIDEECAKPENAVNSAKLNELAARQQECRERLETCYETWEDLSMQLDGAKDS